MAIRILSAENISGALTVGGTTTLNGFISQVTSASVIGSFKGTSAPGYAEFNILNDVSHAIVIGSIGSTYSNVDWAGSTYIYNTGSKKMYIKSQNEMRFTTNGTSISSNTALVLDTSYNATFSGNITINGGQILTPGGVNIALNPNTGTVTVGGIIQCSGAGTSTFAGNATFAGTVTTSDVYGASSLRVAALGGILYLDSGSGASTIMRTNGTTTALTLDNGQNATFAGNVTVTGNLIGKSDNTTEVGTYSTGAIKRIRMTQGGEIHFGDTTTANALGITEGAWDNFGDQDRIGLYCRNELKVYGNSNVLRLTIPTNADAIFAAGATFAGSVSTTGSVSTNNIITSAGSLIINDPQDTNSNLIIAGRYDLGAATLSFRSGHGGNSNVWDMATILVEDDANYNGRIMFRTSPSGYGNTPTTKMTIRSSGAVAFGTGISDYGSSGQVLTSNGNASPSWQAAGGSSSPWTTTGNDIYYTTGEVGINNTTPGSFGSDNNQLVVGSGSGRQGITIYSATNGESSIRFSSTVTTFTNDMLLTCKQRDSQENNYASLIIQHEFNELVKFVRQGNDSQIPKVKLGYNNPPTQDDMDQSMLQIAIPSSINNPGIVIYGDSNGNDNPYLAIKHTGNNNYDTPRFIKFYNYSGSVIGQVQQNFNSNSVSYSTSSDYRLKDNLKPFKALDIVSNIKVYNFHWIGFDDKAKEHGVLAHELQELIPEAVSGEKDKTKDDGSIDVQQVDYSRIIPHLIQSIQDLKSEVDKLKKQIL